VITQRLKHDASFSGQVRSTPLLGLLSSGMVPPAILMRHFAPGDGDALLAQSAVSAVRPASPAPASPAAAAAFGTPGARPPSPAPAPTVSVRSAGVRGATLSLAVPQRPALSQPPPSLQVDFPHVFQMTVDGVAPSPTAPRRPQSAAARRTFVPGHVPHVAPHSLDFTGVPAKVVSRPVSAHPARVQAAVYARYVRDLTEMRVSGVRTPSQLKGRQ
jgi:hypothetical protein